MWIKAKEKSSDDTIFLNPDHIVKIYSEGESVVAETTNITVKTECCETACCSIYAEKYVIFEKSSDPWYEYYVDDVLPQVITSIESAKTDGKGILDLNETLKVETFIKKKKSRVEIENLSVEELERHKK